RWRGGWSPSPARSRPGGDRWRRRHASSPGARPRSRCAARAAGAGARSSPSPPRSRWTGWTASRRWPRAPTAPTGRPTRTCWISTCWWSRGPRGRRLVGAVLLDDVQDLPPRRLPHLLAREIAAGRLVLELEHPDEARRLPGGCALHEALRAVQDAVPRLAQERPERPSRRREGL